MALITILIVLFGGLSLVDGIIRVRGRRVSTILSILEIVLGALLLVVTLFTELPVSIDRLWVAIALEVVLVIVIVTRGSGRGRGWLGLTGAAAIAGLIVILNLLGILQF